MKFVEKIVFILASLLFALGLSMLPIQAAEDQNSSYSFDLSVYYPDYVDYSRSVLVEGVDVKFYTFVCRDMERGYFQLSMFAFSPFPFTYAYNSDAPSKVSNFVSVGDNKVYYTSIWGVAGGKDPSIYSVSGFPNITTFDTYTGAHSDLAKDIAEEMAAAGFYDYDDSQWATDRPEFKPDTSGAKSADFKLLDVRITNDIRADWSGISNYSSEDQSNDFVKCEITLTTSSEHNKYLDMGCFHLSDGYISLPFDDIDIGTDFTLKSVKLIPFHYLNGDPSGILVKGTPSIRYFDGSFKSPSKYLPSDWIYSDDEAVNNLGYLQKVTYNLRTSSSYPYGIYDVVGWDTSLIYPDAYIEMMADIKYRTGSASVTRRIKFLSHYDEVSYSLGHYEFLKEDFFPDYDGVEVQYYYIRLSAYDKENEKYIYGGWTRIDPHNLLSNNINTVVIDSDNNTNIDSETPGSYSYGMGADGTFEDPIDWNDVSFDKFENISFSWFMDMSKSIVGSLGAFPALVNATLGFLPSAFTSILGVLLLACVILRFLGR